jgi:hypothetical protein
MVTRTLVLLIGAVGLSAGLTAPAAAQDASICLTTAERVDSGEQLSADEKQKAHEACIRALTATGNVLQKFQFQEADFAITGTRHTF